MKSKLRMIISQKQMQMFSSSSTDAFDRRVLEHVKKHFPRKVARLGTARTRQQISAGRVAAKGYGFKTERLACKYIDLTFGFHPKFDREPWAEAVLRKKAYWSPDQRMEKLMDRAKEELRQRKALHEREAHLNAFAA